MSDITIIVDYNAVILLSLSLLICPLILILTIYFLFFRGRSVKESVMDSLIGPISEERKQSAFEFLNEVSGMFFDDKEETEDIRKALNLKRRLKNTETYLKDINE